MKLLVRETNKFAPEKRINRYLRFRIVKSNASRETSFIRGTVFSTPVNWLPASSVGDGICITYPRFLHLAPYKNRVLHMKQQRFVWRTCFEPRFIISVGNLTTLGKYSIRSLIITYLINLKLHESRFPVTIRIDRFPTKKQTM